MLKLITKLLQRVNNDIDSGNSNLTEEETLKLIEVLKAFTDREVRLSKYQSCQYLGMRRASFDNYVRAGKLPRGLKQQGFKELFWTKRSLDDFIRLYRKS